MPKTPSKKLFDLVKSLSSAEKRYFKVFVSKKNDSKNKYVTLFDAIESQTTFDDEALIKSIYGDAKIQSRKYSELKAYLFDLILKCLQAYDEKSSVVTQISNMLGNVQVLFKRGHFEDCKDVLKKTKKIALKYEEFSQLYEILQWEKWLAHTTIDIDFLDNQLDRIEDEEKQYLQQLNNLAAYRNLFLKLYLSLKKNAADEDLFNFIESNSLVKKLEFKSHRAKVLHFRVKSLLAYARENVEEFYIYNKELITEMESQPHFLNENVSEYISSLSNYCMSCKLTKHYEELEIALEKFKSIKTLNYDDELKVHRQYYQILFSMCILNGNFEKAKIALKDHFAKVEKFDANLFERKTFYFYYSYIYFGCEDYEQALVYLNVWLDLPKTVERPYYKMLARIFNLVLHYEMKNNLLLESLLRSTYRFLKKENQLHEIERAFLTFIRNSLKVANKSELNDQLVQLKVNLEKINDGKPARIGQFDLSAWVESKLENRSFAEVVQSRFVEAS